MSMEIRDDAQNQRKGGLMHVEHFPIIYAGSTKNVREAEKVERKKPGKHLLEMRDSTSIDDFGDMGEEWETPGKREAMFRTIVYNFEKVQERYGRAAVPTAYLGKFNDNTVIVEGFRVIDPDKGEFPRFRRVRSNAMIPWEVIVRNAVTGTSSAAKRMKYRADDKERYHERLHYSRLGLDHKPTKYPIILPMPFIDLSTKQRKPHDQYLSPKAMQRYANLESRVTADICRIAHTVNSFMCENASNAGFVVLDFKIELALDEDGQVVVCEMPTFDEMTAAYVGRPSSYIQDIKKLKVFQPGKEHDLSAFMNVSKQPYRDEGRSHAGWRADLERAMKEGRPKSEYPRPPSPNEGFICLMTEMHREADKQWRTGISDLDQVAHKYKRWAAKTYNFSR